MAKKAKPKMTEMQRIEAGAKASWDAAYSLSTNKWDFVDKNYPARKQWKEEFRKQFVAGLVAGGFIKRKAKVRK